MKLNNFKELDQKVLAIPLFFSMVYIACMILIPFEIIDDSYITFTYAKHFALYGKPWYNLDPFFQGSGQTSLLWMWILALGNFIGINSIALFPYLNALMSVYLLFRFAKIFNFQNDYWATSVFKCGLYSFIALGLYLHSTHGLETILEILFLFHFFKDWKDNRKNYWAVGLALIRPELVLFNAVWSLSAFRNKSETIRRMLISGIGVLLFALFYFIYYDFYIPLSALHKFREEFSLLGLRVLVGNLFLFIPVIYLLIQKRQYGLMIMLVFLIYYYTLHVGGYTNVYYRYIFPLLTLYFIYPLRLSISIPQLSINSKFIVLGMSALLMLRLIDLGFNFRKNYINLVNDNETFHSTYHAIANESKTNDKTLVTDAGMIAYYNHGMCYDGLGLNDPTLLFARKTGNWNKYFDYIDQRKINTILIGSLKSDSLMPRFEHEQKITEHYHLRDQPFEKYEGKEMDVYKFQKP